MIHFVFKEEGFNCYRLTIFDDDMLVSVMKRHDCRNFRTAKISLFAYISKQWLSFDNVEIDRFLFL